MNKYIIFYFILLQTYAFSSSKIKEFSWNGVDVVWLESAKFPKFDVLVYLSDGALSDKKGDDGQTSTMFSLLSSGTSKYSQKTLSDKFDFYASGLSSSVTHEYSTIGFSGLSKDAKTLTDLFCHVIKDASFPKSEIKQFKTRSLSQLKNMVTNHSGLASRIFRNVSLKNTPFSTFSSGTSASISKMNRSDFLRKKNYFNENVYKKIFISGPKEVLEIKDIFAKKCEWSGQAKFKRKDIPLKITSRKKPLKSSKLNLYFAPVDGANQAQILLGNYIPVENFKGDKFDLTKLTTSILGGGFTSLLMQELRVKKGLTYGASAHAAPQSMYGRSLIKTSTKNETLLEALITIRDTLNFVSSGKLPQERVSGVKKFLKGKHLLKFESDSSYIGNLVLFDHLGKSYGDLSKFAKEVDKFTKSDVELNFNNLYKWNDQVIFVLGNPSLKSDIIKSKLFNIKELNTKNYL